MKPGDIVFGARRRIGVVAKNESVERPGINTGPGLLVLELPAQVTEMRITENDVHIPAERIRVIAHLVAERVQAAEDDFSERDREAAGNLLEEGAYTYPTDSIFSDPADPKLVAIFEQVFADMHPALTLAELYEYLRAAYMATCSVYMSE